MADDHYHRYAEDVDLMAGLGVAAYRFSVSWPRVLPGGVPNPEGLGFYDRLVDRLLERGIDPWLTLYHWDLPQELEDRGGWPSRDTAHRFAEMAGVVAHRLGDRVKRWTTLNEPWCSAFLGYGSGRHAPGRTDPEAALAAAHHLMLGHGLAVDVVRAAVPDARVGVTLNLYPVTPLDDRPGNLDAARRVDGLQNRWFLDPILRGSYPEDVQADLEPVSGLSWVEQGDLEAISRPLDFLGVNYYTRHVVRAGAYPGVGEVEFSVPHETVAANGWGVDPDGLLEVLERVAGYTDLPIYVTENGSAWEDRPAPDGQVHDPGRARLPPRPPRCMPARPRGRGAARRLLRVVAARQLRVGRGVRRPLRARARRLRHPATHREDQRPLVRRVRARSSHRHTDAMTRATSGGPTLEEVAALAGVGRGTASRVINGSDNVSERSRQAVLDAVAELNYVPNHAARTLMTRRTDAVALVIAESEERIFGEPFFAGVVRGISSATNEAGRQLVLMLSQAGNRTANFENYLSRQHVDGVLLLSLHDDDELPQRIRSRELPVVVGGRARSEEAASVDVDNVVGARLAAEHLTGLGRRHVATITGPLDMAAGRDRHDGFREGLRAAGLELDDSLVASGDFSQESGRRAMAELLARRPDLDAVFCANDPMAAAALQVLRDAGRQVPDDVAVVGFDDSPVALSTIPPLTSVHQSPEEMGRAMVSMLLEQLSDPGVLPRHQVLPTHLVVRASSA